MPRARRISQWAFSEPTLSSLPLDPKTDTDPDKIRSRQVPRAIFSLVRPTPLKPPRKLVAVSNDVLSEVLDMDPSIVDDPDFLDFVSGNKVLEGTVPMAHRYGGHQFGVWAGQLGDGRAHLLGEYINSVGDRWELQLKGSGRTPYSRFADGRAVLRSSVREFLGSEAMFYLGIPTSRAASLVITEEPIIPRDQFYDGNFKMEKAAVVLRVAPTWFRMGSLEILSRNGEIQELRNLVDFVRKVNFPDIEEETDCRERPSTGALLSLFSRVTEETARLIASWMSVGFVHGVMNTDNLSLASVTIDYGPFGFVDDYDPYFIPNTSDDFGRYDLENQPSIGLWNLQRMADAIKPLLSKSDHHQLDKITSGYEKLYQTEFLRLFRAKLGLSKTCEVDDDVEDMRLLALLLDSMERNKADFTMTFRELSETNLNDVKEGNKVGWGLEKIVNDETFKRFVERYSARLEKASISDEERMHLMQASNPRYILRNWMAQTAIEKLENDDDFGEIHKILRVLKKPFERQEEAEASGYASRLPTWSHSVKVSCSS